HFTQKRVPSTLSAPQEGHAIMFLSFYTSTFGRRLLARRGVRTGCDCQGKNFGSSRNCSSADSKARRAVTSLSHKRREKARMKTDGETKRRGDGASVVTSATPCLPVTPSPRLPFPPSAHSSSFTIPVSRTSARPTRRGAGRARAGRLPGGRGR